MRSSRASSHTRYLTSGRFYTDQDPKRTSSIAMRNDSPRATAISAGFVGFDSRRVDIDSLRVDIASAVDLPRRGDNARFRAAHILLSHAGHRQQWRDECDGKDVFDSHDFLPHLLESVAGTLQVLSRRCSSMRRDNAYFLGFDETVLPAAQARAAEPRRPRKKTAFQTSPLADCLKGIGGWHAICDA